MFPPVRCVFREQRYYTEFGGVEPSVSILRSGKDGETIVNRYENVSVASRKRLDKVLRERMRLFRTCTSLLFYPKEKDS